MDDVTDVVDLLMRYGLEYFRVFPGMYRAIVDRVDDPQERGRIQVRVPSVSGATETINVWVKPALWGAGLKRGWFWPPDEGDVVYVGFRGGHPGKPEFYIGGFYGYPDEETDVPDQLGYSSGGLPEKRGMRTRAGHYFVFNDEAGQEAVELVWNQPTSSPSTRAETASDGSQMSLRFTKDGIVILADKESQKITINGQEKKIVIEDANGNTVTLDSSGATIKSSAISLGDQADSQAMRYMDWLQWAVAHTHPTPSGPSGPPAQPPPTTIASSVVRLK